MKLPVYSPWGQIHHSEPVNDECYWVGTSGHGGLKLSRRMNSTIPKYMRRAGGWYEEDCEWAIVAMVHPALFEKRHPDQEAVKKIVRDYYPDDYARYFNLPLSNLEGSSYILDQRLFKERHANDWVVIAAWGSWHENVPDGMVGMLATKGGQRKLFNGPSIEERYFLTTSSRYDARPAFGYVIASDDKPWIGP